MKDISRFNNISDYLPLLNGSLIADIIVLYIVYYTPFFNSKHLMNWYETYRLSAVLADVLILMIGIVIARYIFSIFNISWNIWMFIATVLLIQVVHDVLFFWFFSSIPRGKNVMFDVFKDYANEVSFGAILGDSFMIILAVLLSSYLASISLNANIITLITALYIIPYILYTR